MHGALVDSGCSRTLMSKAVCRRWEPNMVEVLTAGGNTLKCCGVGRVELVVGHPHPIPTVVGRRTSPAWDRHHHRAGRSTHRQIGRGALPPPRRRPNAPPSRSVSPTDFSATFDHRRKAWTASRRWAAGRPSADTAEKASARVAGRPAGGRPKASGTNTSRSCSRG